MFSSSIDRHRGHPRADQMNHAVSDATNALDASASQAHPSYPSPAGSAGTDIEKRATTQTQITTASRDLKRGARAWKLVLAYGILPGLVLILAVGAGYLKWRDGTADESRSAAVQAVAEASEITVSLLSYKPDTVEKDLDAAHDRVTGPFKEAYTRLIHDVVIPGAVQQRISAVATVPAAAPVAADASHAVVLVFVNQTITVGNDAPTNTASSVRVTLEKINGSWLISQFDPV